MMSPVLIRPAQPRRMENGSPEHRSTPQQEIAETAVELHQCMVAQVAEKLAQMMLSFVTHTAPCAFQSPIDQVWSSPDDAMGPVQAKEATTAPVAGSRPRQLPQYQDAS